MVEAMRSVVTDPEAPAAVRLGERPMREPHPDEAVVRVSHLSLNRGELRFAPGRPAGSPIGWDVVGTIERKAASGGPAVGERVVAFSRRQEGWAERAPIPAADLAVVPESVASPVAAALPVAACTALACVDRARRLVGRRALVTGVTGGVGGFGVQLARAAGAWVVAQVRHAEQVDAAKALGADEVVVTEDGAALATAGPFAFVMDGVGGRLLGVAVDQLEADGVAVAYGVTGAPTTELPIGTLLGKGRARITGLNLYGESAVEPVGRFLCRLLRLVQQGRLRVDLVDRGSWANVGEAARDLLDRRFSGKAVLSVD